MLKLAAATCFVCAAFALVPPGIDRLGLVALGAGLAALATWRVRVAEPRNRLAAALSALQASGAPPPQTLAELYELDADAEAAGRS